MVVLEMVVSAPILVVGAQMLMQTLDLAVVAAEVETHSLVVMVLLVLLSSLIQPDKYLKT
tara:strand:+ start:398 stop:577 length:180 start_codon:yes stop_codon:yes gene_type:complete